jgi:hypothetical protein
MPVSIAFWEINIFVMTFNLTNNFKVTLLICRTEVSVIYLIDEVSQYL